jgi:hypothetical protein
LPSAQFLVSWQAPQSLPFIGGCVKPVTGSAANGAATSWQFAQPPLTPL